MRQMFFHLRAMMNALHDDPRAFTWYTIAACLLAFTSVALGGYATAHCSPETVQSLIPMFATSMLLFALSVFVTDRSYVIYMRQRRMGIV